MSTSTARPTAERAVLIIDDERRLADSLQMLLQDEGYRAEVCYGGAEGIERLGREPFPVVITDLKMQGVGGLQVVKHIHDHLPKTLVIVVTGYASADSAIEALHYHAFDYLRKPVEIDDLKRSLDRAFHKLEVDQIREDTAAMITHDIKLPLTSIIGFAALLTNPETGEINPRAGEFAETILANGRKVIALIDNYLTSFKVETGNLKSSPIEVHISEFLRSLGDIYAPEAKRNGFTLKVESSTAPERAKFDENLMFRAVGNLLQNAIKYGDSAGAIVLEVAKCGAADSPLACESMRFSVINRAPFLREEELAELFGRCKRSAATHGIEGSGLGLYVVDAVTQAHDGRAEAVKPNSDHVRFSIWIPLENATR